MVLGLMFCCLGINAYASDISQWARDDVDYVFKSDLVDETYFDDYHRYITREEYGYLIFQLHEYLSDGPIAYDVDMIGTYDFTDSDSIYLNGLKAAGLINGYGDGSYRPDAMISREEIMTLYVRLIEHQGYDLERTQSVFADDSLISDWARDNVYKCHGAGIIKGRGDNRVDPQGYATIEESLVVFSRIIQNDRFQSKASAGFNGGDYVISDRNDTYIISFDLTGNPNGIDQYRDFDYVGPVVSEPVGNRLSMDGDILYYTDEDGYLKRQGDGHSMAEFRLVDDVWYVQDSKLYVNDSEGYKVFDVITGVRLEGVESEVGVDFDLDLVGGRLILNGDRQLFSDVSSFTVSGDTVLAILTNGSVSGYDIASDTYTAFGRTDYDRIIAYGNYVILEIALHNGAVHRRVLPIFDLRSYL